MAEQTRLFLGLIRPPKLLGLPIMYAVVWLFGAALLFVWVQHWTVGVLMVLAYPVLWKAADWDPHFLDVVSTVLQHTPPSLDRSDEGTIDYAP
ncbi:type IV secretion system protein VirB3 [Rubellimicrobium roseum]|uniref:Type IV secretion system protein VirB3 n=1 Tax=Rubellimicrobium roseum TaxID=687525 RepID=A0A5C4NAV3_9RHOB|nr:VirB3 family type IV secretion system protein [Rubellimicrobium roseum]TNC66277.1 type IV secretion system protein VirB3 [Rubellimicrobium roseum]